METDKIQIEFKGILDDKNITTTVVLELGKKVEYGSKEYKDAYSKLNHLFAKLNEI